MANQEQQAPIEPDIPETLEDVLRNGPRIAEGYFVTGNEVTDPLAVKYYNHTPLSAQQESAWLDGDDIVVGEIDQLRKKIK